MARTYELVLMLDPQAEDEAREQIALQTSERLVAEAAAVHESVWGMRPMAYEIRHRAEADYRFWRFEAEPPLLEALNHSLRIADGVLRFRIFEVDPRYAIDEPTVAEERDRERDREAEGDGRGRGRGRGRDRDAEYAGR